MGHEITETDSAVYYKEKAWHGLGYVVEQAMSPREALRLSGLDWEVDKSLGLCTYDPTTGTQPPNRYTTDQFCAITRKDNGVILSVQTPDYQVVQNSEVFDLAYSLGSGVKVESAFSMQGGKRIAVLLRGDTFTPPSSPNDEITKYLALLSSHDGTVATTGIGTSVRVVCANTMKMAIAGAKGKAKTIRFIHSGDIEEKKRIMCSGLEQFTRSGLFFQEQVNALSATNWNTEQIQRFFLDMYGMLEEEVVLNPTTDQEYKNYLNAKVTISRWSESFDKERKELVAPPSAWQATNAITRDLQHRVSVKGRKTSWENKAYANLMGASQDDTLKVMSSAMQLVM